jgi:hypothetical protein
VISADKQQNGVSKQIYQDQHNANMAQYDNNKVAPWRENQQDRIASGREERALPC